MTSGTKYKYAVDLTEKPQDPGQINQLCLLRSKNMNENKMKNQNNAFTVGVIDKLNEIGIDRDISLSKRNMKLSDY